MAKRIKGLGATRTDTNTPRYKLIACEIFFREVCRLLSEVEPVVDVEFLRKGLHDAGKDVMRSTLQHAIDAADPDRHQAVLLAYGRCNDGVAGLHAPAIPLVIPRAHDCIAVFFGSLQRYEEYFQRCPGTYFRTTGWTERDEYDEDSVMHQLGLDRTYEEYVEKYGRENADYILETLGWQNKYKQLTYIDMGLERDEPCRRIAQDEARQRNLAFDAVDGDLRFLRKLLTSPWNDDEFVVVPPHGTIATNDEGRVLNACPPAHVDDGSSDAP